MDKSKNLQFSLIVTSIRQAGRSSFLSVVEENTCSSSGDQVKTCSQTEVSEVISFSKLCPIFPHCLSTKRWQTFSVISKRVTGFCFEGQEAKLRSLCAYLCNLLEMSNPLLGHRPYENRQQVGFRSWAIVC